MNSITELLNLEDENLITSDISIEGTSKKITLKALPVPRYCPACGFRMHSKVSRHVRLNIPSCKTTTNLFLS